MIESLDHFFGRTYADFTLDKVWVYNDSRRQGTFQVWTISKAGEYVRYLMTQ